MILKDMLKSGYAQPIPKGVVIFKENEQGAEMYIVLKGSVEISMETGGRKIKLADIQAGGFFGEMTLLEGLSRTATAVTTADSVLLVITKNNFDDVIAGSPKLALGIMKGLSGRIRQLNQRLKISTPGEDNPPETVAAAPDPVPGSSQPAENPADNPYLFPKKITCPVCGGTFETYLIRNSKLKQSERTNELRVLYADIEPLHYNIWVCPQCAYAMKKSDFEKISDLMAKNLANQSEARKAKFTIDFSNPYSTSFALVAHRIALECNESFSKNEVDEKAAGLWLSLAWLYDDIGDAEKAKEARGKSLQAYQSVYSKGTGVTEDTILEYLLGRLCFGLGNYQEARNYWFKAQGRRGGNEAIKQMARNGLEDLKSVLA